MNPLDVPTTIAQRRAHKQFKSDEIPADLLHRLVELTVSAPSSWNLQDWRIVVVQDETQRQALSEAAWGQQQIVQAPVTFVFAAHPYAWKTDLDDIFAIANQSGAWDKSRIDYLKNAIPQFQEKLGDKNREYAIKDATIAATHLMLAAESLGLATCPMNGWLEEKVKEVIGAEDSELAIAVLIPVGYPADSPQNPGRLPLSHNVFRDRVNNPYE